MGVKNSHRGLLGALLMAFANVSILFGAQDPGLVLGATASTSNGFNLILNGEYGVGYTIQSSSNLIDWVTVGTNSNPSATRTITITNPPGDRGYYRAAHGPLPLFGYALAATGGNIVINGNAVVDSYDSSVGPYASTNRKANAIVATTSTATNAISLKGSSQVYGWVATGPGGTVTWSGTSSIGDINWVNGASVGIEPGHATNNFNVSFPGNAPLPLPPYYTSLPGGGIVGGISYTYIVGSGNYELPSLSIGGIQTMAVTGQAVIYVTNGFSVVNSGYVSIQPGASLTLYAGGTISIGGAGIVNASGYATNCTIIGLNMCTNITLSAASPFIGTIYAPQAALAVTSPAGWSGAGIANSITLTTAASMHYDEDLARVGPTR